MVKNVIKRDGTVENFDKMKIYLAVQKANAEVFPELQASDEDIENIFSNIEMKYGESSICTIEEIQDEIEYYLMSYKKELARKFIKYRHTRSILRNAASSQALEKSVLSLIQSKNKEVMEENANKPSTIASCQRDLIAGEVSKDLTRRVLLPEKISKAHDEGILHFHDADYFLQPIFNCCLVNIGDMLDNGTAMNNKLIESPKSFQVACTVMTQIISSIAGSQYGGQSVAINHLGKYLRKSYNKYIKRLSENHPEFSDDTIKELATERTREELTSGIQTIQYQLNTLYTTNGQTPFVTIFLNLDTNDEYVKENALIIQEILQQRLNGIKNDKGVVVTPLFPKLIYVLDEHNCLKGGEYDYLTRLAVKCSAKRMYPDYISAKKMRENYEGEVFSCMGCRSFLSPWKDENGNYKWEGRFNQGVVSINLPRIAIESTNGGKDEPDFDKFWELLGERLELCRSALMCRHKALLGVSSDVSPIHWQHGAIARLKKGEKIDKLLKDGYSTISLGYIGVYEMTKLMTGESHTSEKGKEFALKVMNSMREACERWKRETGLGFGLYGTPAESLCYRFAKIDTEKFGIIKDVTDKGYYTNSYHVDVRENIDIFSKFRFESQFQTISSGGAISYAEIPNMQHNLEAVEDVVRFIYDNIQYAEFNTRSDLCLECGFDGEVIINDNNEWECPCCNNKDVKKLVITRRVCGYLGGENGFNFGKLCELRSRRLHL